MTFAEQRRRSLRLLSHQIGYVTQVGFEAVFAALATGPLGRTSDCACNSRISIRRQHAGALCAMWQLHRFSREVVGQDVWIPLDVSVSSRTNYVLFDHPASQEMGNQTSTSLECIDLATLVVISPLHRPLDTLTRLPYPWPFSQQKTSTGCCVCARRAARAALKIACSQAFRKRLARRPPWPNLWPAVDGAIFVSKASLGRAKLAAAASFVLAL